MKDKRVKFPKKYKYGWRLIGDPINFIWVWLFRIPKSLFRPICWLVGHKYHIVWPYGVKIKVCERCGDIKFRKRTTERVRNFYIGEIGELHGVRFIESKKEEK